MKTKNIIFIIVLIIIFSSNCKKEISNEIHEDPQNEKMEYTKNDSETTIDFVEMRKKIKNSDKINIEVFFAISVYHKYYISQYIEDVNHLSEEDQKIFFLQKKKGFFNSIKYSEEEYNRFMENNIDEMNIYINSHKDIQEYLLSIN